MTNEEIVATFLKEKGCYNQYVGNRKRDATHYKENENVSIHRAIVEGFSWHYTPQDSTYWRNLDNELIRMCRHLKLSGNVTLDKI